MAPDSTIPVDEIWLSALRAAGRRPKTLEIYNYALGQLKVWRGDDDLATMSRFEALAFAKHLNETFKPSGVDSRLKAIKAFYNWAITEELITENPFRRITVTIPDDPRPPASDYQIEAMLTSAKRSRRDLALLTLLVDSGARKGEIAAVTFADLDLRSGVVTFTESKSRPRTVGLNERTIMALTRWLRQRGVGSGSLWSVGDPYSLVRQAVKRHSRGQLSPHAIRRAFAVRWLTNGGSRPD